MVQPTCQHSVDTSYFCLVTSPTIIHWSLWAMHWRLAALPVQRRLTTTICWSTTVWAEGALLEKGPGKTPVQLLQPIMKWTSLYHHRICNAFKENHVNLPHKLYSFMKFSNAIYHQVFLENIHWTNLFSLILLLLCCLLQDDVCLMKLSKIQIILEYKNLKIIMSYFQSDTA